MTKKRPVKVSLFPQVKIINDPISGLLSEQRQMQPFAAKKTYICPGCNQEIRPGTGHIVIVPLSSPHHRRHWHTACWDNRHNRPPA